MAALSLWGGCRRSLAPDDAGGTGHIGLDADPDAIVNTGADGGGGGGDATGETTVDAAADATADAAADAIADAGTFACGKLLCAADDLCVMPFLCGGPVNCQEVPDGGACPPDTTFNPSCPSGRPGCVPVCPPPSPFCAPRPAACGDTLDCVCARAVCSGRGACVFVSGRSVTCGIE